MPTAPSARSRPRSAAACRRSPRPAWHSFSLAAVLALALGAPACAHRPRPVLGPHPIALSDADVRDIAAILRFEDRREYDAEALAALVRRATPEVRRRAYLAAGRIGDPGARTLVRAGLRDTTPAVRAAAAFALGLLRDSAAVSMLGSLALGDSGAAAVNAVFALGRIGWHGRDPLVMALAVGNASAREIGLQVHTPSGEPPGPRPPDVLAQALLTIWRFPRDSTSLAVVRPFASSPDTALRWRAAYALMRLGDPAGVSALLRLITDAQPEVRALAARGLRATVVDSAGRRAQAQAALLSALADTAAHVRINAAGALAGYRDSATVQPLARLLGDPDRNVALAAAGALGTSRQASAAEALGALADSPTAPLPLRAAALEALARVAPDAALARVTAWAAAPAWRQRYYAASAAAAAPARLAAGQLAGLARDTDARVAAQALSAFAGPAPDSASPPRPLLVELLDAPDPIVRASAIAALRAHPDAGDLELFLDSYARAAADTLDDAALAAVDALAALQKAGGPAAASFFARFQRSPDPVVRRAVARALGGAWGPPVPVVTHRDSAFYQDIVRRLVAPVLAGGPPPRVLLRTAASARPGKPGTGDNGRIVLDLDPAEAPLTVANFLALARMHFFDGNRWHRVVPNFVVQDGDPRGDGNGGPGWQIRDELSPLPYLRGALGMALSGPDTGGSQFFITLSAQPHLDAGYTVFGHVEAGWDVVDRVLQDDVITGIEVIP